MVVPGIPHHGFHVFLALPKAERIDSSRWDDAVVHSSNARIRCDLLSLQIRYSSA